ncbi:dihydroxyacetone phosphate acyltransferase-like [Engystomops pustulosus]|uniref:dihydroxyacetone phosphate acyltransferase-like n=1 Tax=Engystomops pustulosus TaxID=76066 RepID=UPI003AFAE086
MFIHVLQLAFMHLAKVVIDHFTEKQYISGLRNFVTQRILTGATKCYEALSSDIQKNTLASFVQLGILEVSKLGEATNYMVKKKAMADMETKLGLWMSGMKISVARL